MSAKVTIQMVVTGTPQALADFRAANSGAQQFAKGANAAFRGLQGTLSTIRVTLASIGLAVGAAQILAFGAATAAAARETGDAAKSYGTVASRLSALNAITDLSNEKQEVMAKGLSNLGSKLDDLKRGEPAATAAFARLGLKASDFPGDDVAVAADTVARALARMSDGATKGAVAAGVLGEKVGRKLIPVFQKLVDMDGLEGAIGYAKRTGKFVDDATVATLEQLTQALKQVKLQASSAALEFVKGFGPEAVALVNDLSQSFDPRGTSALQAWGNAAGKWIRIAVAELRMAAVYADSVGKRISLGLELTALSMPVAEPGRPLTAQEAADAVIRQRRIQEGLQEQAAIRKRTKARLDALYLEAEDESEIHVAASRRDQLVDDESYSAGLMRLNKYLVERNNRIRTETFAQVTARGNIIKTLEKAGPLEGDDVERVAALRQEIKLLRKEEEQRLAAPPPSRRKGVATPSAAGATSADLAETDRAELQAAQAQNAALEAKAKERYDAGLGSLRAYYTARRDTIRNNESAELDLLTAEWLRAQKIQDPGKRENALKQIDAKTTELLAKSDQQRTEADTWYAEERTKLEKSLAAVADKRRAAEDQEHESKLREIAEIQEAERKTLVALGPDTDAGRTQAAARAQSDADALSRAEEFRYKLERARAELESLVSSGTLSDADIERFRKLEKTLEAMAVAIGPAAVASVHAFGNRTDEAAKKEIQLTDYGQAAAGALAEGFSEVGDEINSASDALLNFIRLLGKALEQVAATRLAEKLISFIPGLTPTKKAAAGGLLVGPSHARGGIILEAEGDEWFSPRWLTRRPGVLPVFEGLRSGRIPTEALAPLAASNPRPAPYQLRVPDWGNTMLRRYSEGGLVMGPRSTTVTTHSDVAGVIHVAPEPGAVITAMRTPEGQKVFLEIAAKNSRTLQRITGVR